MIAKKCTRRRLLRNLSVTGAVISTFSAAWPLASLAQSTALAVHKLNDNFSLITGAGGNVVLGIGDNAALLVDSGNQVHIDALLAQVDSLTGQVPVTTLFNTHWHPDHTGGNEEFRARGAKLIAHENTRLWLTAEFDVYWRNTSHEPRPASALPTDTFYESGIRRIGGHTVQHLHYPQAHTDGDIALYFPDANILVAGGLMSDGSYPVTDIATGGWLGGLLEANEAMLALADDDTIIIPDKGLAKSKADLHAQFDMLSDIYAQMKALMQMGYSGQDMLEAQVTKAYDAQWGDPTEFVLETYRGLWAHTSDMGGFI